MSSTTRVFQKKNPGHFYVTGKIGDAARFRQRYFRFFLIVLEYSSISFAGLLSSFNGSGRSLQKSTVSRSICIPLRPSTEYGRPEGRRSGTLVLSTKKRGRVRLSGILLEGISPLLIHVLMV
jgi:hypothetical protein